MIVTVANLKGGAGKTTAAIHLGQAIHATDRPVAVVDSDRQGSALRWSDQANAVGESLPFDVVSLATIALASRIDGIAANRSVVIDCGPGDADIMTAAIEVADVVVIPANTRADDIEQARLTAKQCRAMDIPHGVLFSRVRPSENSGADFRAELEDAGIHVFATEIRELVQVGFAFGGPIETVAPFDQLLTELETMAS